jgi:tetratricopeptide (TPR) repeat protein/tRNA A-37 threonylcarbamoyl transferase component Bud32
LGRGGAGEVWLAEDQRSKSRVAVKIFQPAAQTADAATERLRFKREFFTLARLDHPAIVKVHELQEHGGMLCYSMEYIAGHPLRSALQRAPRRGRDLLSPLWSAGEQLLTALAYLHSQGIVHRDLKSENLLLTPEGTLKLIDFDLILPRAVEFNAAALGELAGTLRTMAPEQIRALGVDGRADLYSAGAILYELATGRPPFRATSGEALLHKHLHTPPVPPRRINRAISAAHQNFILRLLEKSPDARFPSALDALVALRRCREAGRSRRAQTPAAPQSASLLIAPYIGNTPVVARARVMVERLARGRGGMLQLGGGAGAGKTRLLDELQGWAVGRAMTVWRGAAREAGGLPAQLFQDLFAQFAASRTAAAGAAPPAALALHFPALQPLLPAGTRLPAPLAPAAERSRLVAAFLVFMHQMTARRPLLLLFDDVQWVDSLSLELLDELLLKFNGGGKAANGGILVALAHRDDPVGRRSELLSWLRKSRTLESAATRMTLAPLKRAESALLMRAMLGIAAKQPLPQAAALHRLTGGNPYYLTATMHALAAAGGKDFRLSLDQQNPSPPPDHFAAETPRPAATLQAALERQLLPFAPAALAALQRAALIGREFSFAWWQPVSGLDENKLLKIAEQALRLGVLEERRGDRLVFTHELLRAQLLSTLPARRKVRLHGWVLSALEQFSGAGPAPTLELLAAQSLAAGLADRSAHYGHIIARKLFDLYQWESALALLRRVERLHGPHNPMADKVRLTHLEITSRILFSRGEDTLVRPRLEVGAQLARRMKERALEQFFRLRLARLEIDRGNPGKALPLARAALAIARARRDAAGQAMAHRLIALIQTARDKTAAAGAHLDAALSAARLSGDRRVEMNVLNDRSGHLYHAGRLRPATLGFQRVLKISKRTGNKLEAAVAHVNLGELAIATGPLSAARRLLNVGLSGFVALGAHGMREIAPENLARCALLEGDPRRALALLREARKGERGGPAARASGTRALALGGIGRRAAAAREMQRAIVLARKSGHAGREAHTLLLGLELSLLLGDAPAARRALKRALQLTRRRSASFLAPLVGSYGARLSPADPALRARAARSARGYAAAGHRLYEFICLRNLAAGLLSLGRTAEAEKLLRQPVRQANRLGFGELAKEMAALRRAPRPPPRITALSASR